MEIDVTPDGNTEINSLALCHEQEPFQSAPVECTAPSSAFGTQSVASNDPLSTISSKKTIKHALRQQAKRRKRNSIASNNSSASVPRILVKRLPPDSGIEDLNAVPQISSRTPTMKEVLASIPGFNMKTRKRTNKKLSTAAQLEQTKAGCIDLETPDSILVNTNLRLLLNKGTFASLPVLYQNKLSQLLPLVDRQLVNNSTDPNCIEISSGLNNEFFARACLEWQDRLAEGEFTPENQQKLKLEADKERSKLDPWKLKHFEPIWGDRGLSGSDSSPCRTAGTSRPSLKTTIKLRPSTTSATSKSKAPPLPPPVKKLRTVGAMTRSCTILKEEISKPISENKSQIPDLLPIKQVKSKVQSGDVHHKAEEVFIPDAGKDEAEEAAPSCPSDTPTVEIHDNCIVNISEAILENNQETIIICREDITTESEKRPRSASSDSYENSPKRSKSMSPLALSPEPADGSELKDPLDITSEVPSDDEKVSEPATESIEPIEDRIVDENSSSSCSLPAHNLEDTSSSQVIETVDSLQLHMNYIDEEPNEISQGDDNSSSTSATSTNTDVKSEQGSEMTQDQDDTMTSIPEGSNSSQETNSQQENKESFSESMQTLSTFCHSPAPPEPELAADNVPQSSEPETIDPPDTSDHVMEEALPDNFAVAEPVEKMEQQIQETFQMLPNSLIIQQESMVLQKPEFAEDIITEVTAEKLEASVEEADLVSFAAAKIIQDDDGEDRFIDAENYVLESGQITVSTSEKNSKKPEEDDIQATLFGDAAVTTGKRFFPNAVPLRSFCPLFVTCCSKSIKLVFFSSYGPIIIICTF